MKVSVFKYITDDIEYFNDTYCMADVILVSSKYDIIKNPDEMGNIEVGTDLYCLKDFKMKPFEIGKKVKTGVKGACKPGLHFEVRLRSGIGVKTPLRLSNSVGTIDPSYRGDISLLLDNFSNNDYEVEKGTRICQLCLIPYIPMNSSNYIVPYPMQCLTINYYLSEEIYNNFDKLFPGSRGNHGFGSTGIK